MTPKWSMQSKKSLGNSTWNHFLSELCGDFLYKVSENQISLDQLAELSYYPSKLRALDKTQCNNWSFRTWQMYMDRHVTSFVCTTSRSLPHIPHLSGDRSAICHGSLLPEEAVKETWYCFVCKYSTSYRLTHGIKNLALYDKPTIVQQSCIDIFLLTCLETSNGLLSFTNFFPTCSWSNFAYVTSRVQDVESIRG